ncbi:MAG: hypothetical protein IH604_18905 [Burkholderiales bacterium]|nr:hypothetical protein [Burkholderiales bacterium]
MKALKNILTAKHGFMAEGPAWAVPAETVAVKNEAAAGLHLKNVALFLAAPFIGLAYLITFPLVGMGMIAWMVGKKLLANKTARPILLAVAAPFVSIAFVTVGPVVGLGAMAYVGGRALLNP